MTKKKAIILCVIIGIIALLEIGSAVILLFYAHKLQENEVKPGPSVTTGPVVTTGPSATTGPTETPKTTKAPKPTKEPKVSTTPTSGPTYTPTPESTVTPVQTPADEPTGTPAGPTSSPLPATRPTNTPTKKPTNTPTAKPTPTSKPTSLPSVTTKPDDDHIVSPSSSGRLHVEGISLVDEKGDAVQLKGISTAGLQWFPQFVDRTAFHEFRYEWGVNIMRLALYTDEGGYCAGGNKATLKSVVEKGVEYATAEDMYVIIDWHILHDNDPNKYKSEALKFFDEMSAKYKDHDNVIYEICNEPNGGVSWQTIKSYALEVISVIRKNDPHAIIIVGTPTWSQEVDKAAADPIKGYDNIMYTLHFYAGTHQGGLRTTMENALKKGLPIFVTEYGITDASGNGACNESEADKWMALMDRYGVSSCIWNLANKNESSCLIVSSCKKTHGFTQSDLSREGKWFYKMVTNGSGGLLSERPDIPSADNDNTPGDTGNTPGDNPGDTPPVDNSLTPEAPQGTEYLLHHGPLTVTLKLSNTWGGDSCGYQYDITVKNTGAEAIDGWSITIPFGSDIADHQNWCCLYSASGREVTLTNEGWNGHLNPGEEVTGIGLIVVSDEKQQPSAPSE